MKRPPGILLIALALSSCATLDQGPPASPASPPEGSPAWIPLAKGIEYAVLAAASPPLAAHAVRVDLRAEGLVPVVTPARAGEAKSQFVSSFAREADCAVAVNATPFSPSSGTEGEARRLVGLVISDGVIAALPVEGKAALFLMRAKDGGFRADIALQTAVIDATRGGAPPSFAVGGFFIVLSEGEPLSGNRYREARTAVGLSADGRTLYLLVVDGRRPGSVGLTNWETGAWLAWLGSETGMTLDGGGSSAMAIKGVDGIVGIVNVPTEGGLWGRERAVGNCLGFKASPLP